MNLSAATANKRTSSTALVTHPSVSKYPSDMYAMMAATAIPTRSAVPNSRTFEKEEHTEWPRRPDSPIQSG